MKSIAIGICTYNHPEAVYDILGRSVQLLYDYKIDVYYYDGSSDTRTKEIIEAYRNMGFTNLHHIHLPEDPNRFEMIFTGEGMLHDYDYIWPCKDRCMFSEETLISVKECIEENFDIILIGMYGHKGTRKTIYHDAPVFYRDHAWRTTSINTVIYQRQSLLGSFQHWIYPTVFNAYYSHMFHTIAHMDNLNICAISGDQIRIFDSPLATSVWENNIFNVWKDQWIEVNEALPECYAPYIDKVIKQTASLPWLLGDIPRLQELHENGILIPERFHEVETNWERVSDVPIDIVKDIASGSYDPKHDMRKIVSDNEFLNFLISADKMIRQGKMQPAQIPWQSIKNYLGNELQTRTAMNEYNILLIIGTLEDLETMAMASEDSPERISSYIQIVINFILLIEKSEKNVPKS